MNHRRETLITFRRAVGYIQNAAEAHGQELNVELAADLAILATLGPPLLPEEARSIDLENEQGALRRLLVTCVAAEILTISRDYEEGQETPAGRVPWSTDREIRACQTAMHLAYEAEQNQRKQGEEPEEVERVIVAGYLRNHDDGYWMLQSDSEEQI